MSKIKARLDIPQKPQQRTLFPCLTVFSDAQMQSLIYDVLSEVQGCRGELDTHIHSLEEHVEELREGFRSLMPLLSSTLSTQNSSIRHLLREREVKAECISLSGAEKKIETS